MVVVVMAEEDEEEEVAAMVEEEEEEEEEESAATWAAAALVESGAETEAAVLGFLAAPTFLLSSLSILADKNSDFKEFKEFANMAPAGSEADAQRPTLRGRR